MYLTSGFEYGFINTVIFGFFVGYIILLVYWFYQSNYSPSSDELKPKHFVIMPLIVIIICLAVTKNDSECPNGYDVFSKGRYESYTCK